MSAMSVMSTAMMIRPVRNHGLLPSGDPGVASAVIASTRASSAEPGTARHSPALAASAARA